MTNPPKPVPDDGGDKLMRNPLVERYVHPDQFDAFARIGRALGFRHVASGPLVRSSCHAEHQAHGL